MKTLSIIIPTLNTPNGSGWTYIADILENIKKHNDIILSNFEKYEVVTIENKLVNEAWNEWVSKSTWDIVMIINDDIVIEEDVWHYLEQLKEWQVYCPYFTRKDIYTKVHDYNWENIVWFCFALHRKEWRDIPKEIELWFWDNYIYEYMKHNIFWWWNIHHFESKSILSPEHKERCAKIIEQDKINWITIKYNVCTNQ